MNMSKQDSDLSADRDCSSAVMSDAEGLLESAHSLHAYSGVAAHPDLWTCVRRACSLLLVLVVVAWTHAGALPQGRSSAIALPDVEQQLLDALFRQHAKGRDSKRLIVEETASIRKIATGDHREEFADNLRRQAIRQGQAFKEALEDFLLKNKQDTKIAFSTNSPPNAELVSEAEVKRMFSTYGGWDRFYQRFPGSSGLITISRVGIDPKATVAILYLGESSGYLAGSGRMYVMKWDGKRWVPSGERIGPGWHS